MEDSGLFMQWALSTLLEQHEPPPVPAADDVTVASLPDQFGHSASPDCIVPGRPPALEARRWSSGDANSVSDGGGNAPVPVPATERDGLSPSLDSVKRAAAATLAGSVGSRTSQPMSWDFSHSASPRLSNEVMPINYTAAAAAATAAARSSASAPYARDHIIAERKRREKINQRLIELSTIIPGLTKTDKATILGHAVRYVKELQEKLRVLEDGSSKNSRSFSPVLAKKPRTATPGDEDAVLPSYSYPPAASDAEIDAWISGDNVMVRIHCKDAKGVLVKLLIEIEGLHLSIVDTNVMPFLACTLIINIIAKVEEGFNSKPEDIVESLKSALSAPTW